MKIKFTFLLLCILSLCTTLIKAQTWNLTSTMTATLDGSGNFAISTTASAEAMPEYNNIDSVPWVSVKYSIRSAIIGNNVTTIGGFAFSGCMNLSSVTIPSSVTSFGFGAFQTCSSLTSITIPETQTTLWGYTFNGCTNLTTVTIPRSVTTFGDRVFQSCSNLTDVTVEWDTPLIIDEALFNAASISTATLHVPTGTKALYQAAAVWKDFGTIDDGTVIPALSVSPSSLSFTETGGQKTFNITSNTGWIVSSSDSLWLTVSPTSGNNDGTVTVTTTENTKTSPRTATITIRGTGVTAQTISVTQAAAPTLTLSVSPSSLNFAATGEQKAFSVNSNTNWTASSSEPWLTLADLNGDGMINGNDKNADSMIVVTAAANTATTPRTATITINGVGVTSQTISITQQKAATENLDFENSGNVLVGYHGNGGDVVIPDNLGITAIGEGAFEGNSTITSVVIERSDRNRTICIYEL